MRWVVLFALGVCGWVHADEMVATSLRVNLNESAYHAMNADVCGEVTLVRQIGEVLIEHERLAAAVSGTAPRASADSLDELRAAMQAHCANLGCALPNYRNECAKWRDMAQNHLRLVERAWLRPLQRRLQVQTK